jgi:hypothetical protein
MGMELFFIPSDGAQRVSIAELRQRFGNVGANATEEAELDVPILVFAHTDTVLRPTLEEDVITSIVVEFGSGSGVDEAESIGDVLEGAGFEVVEML